MFNPSFKKNFIEINKKKAEEKDLTSLFLECELRVGRVEEVKDMENSESIYCLKVNMGDKLRDVGTGLRKTFSHEEFKGKNVIVFCNLKTKKLGDFVSDGMILCASNQDKTYFELLRPSEKASPGELLYLEGGNADTEVFLPLNDRKFKKANTFFKTDENCIATFNGVKLMTDSGYITVKSLKKLIIS